MKKNSVLQRIVRASKSETNPWGVKIEIKNLHPRYTQLFHLASNGAILIGNKHLLMDELNCDDWTVSALAREFNSWSRYAVEKRKPINWFLIRYHSYNDVPQNIFYAFKELIQRKYKNIEYLQGEVVPQKVRRWKCFSNSNQNLRLVTQ